jgi:dienelactone hydrolase
LLVGVAVASAADFDVVRTFNDAPFRVAMQKTAEKNAYAVYRLTYPSPVTTPVTENNTVPADYYLPKGAADGPRRPAVIVLHILNGNYELERMLCAALATRGVPALMFKLPYYGERSPPGEQARRHPKLFIEAMPQGIEDCRRTIDVLAARPEVDPQRIGVTGISLGGIVAATAAGVDARLHRTALLLAGGDVLTMIHHARETRRLSQYLTDLPVDERRKVEAALASVDPLQNAARLKDRAAAGRVLMVNAAEDDVIPRECTEKLAAAMGMAERVVWLEGLGHYTAIAALPPTLVRTVDFFAQDLPDQLKMQAAATLPPNTPGATLVAIVRQAFEIISSPATVGRCHLVDLSARVTDKTGKTHEGRLRLIRGDGHRFMLDVRVPHLAEAALGQDDRPWMATATKVFVGAPEPGPSVDPLVHADPKYIAKNQALAGGLSALLAVPGLLEPAIDITADDANGERAIVVRVREKDRGSLRVTIDESGRPTKVRFAFDGTTGEATIRAWQINTVANDEMFRPPAGKAVQEVSADDLRCIFSALFNFAMEMSE